ncbi:MAG: fumarate hydratase [Bacillota bacterium]
MQPIREELTLKKISFNNIVEKVAEMAIASNRYLPPDVTEALKKSQVHETSELGREILADLLLNQEIAAREKLPLCQDTGMAVVFVELGQDVHIEGGLLEDAINQGIAKGYSEGYLRKSMLNDPLLRQNTNDNTPAILHIKLVAGSNLKITLAPKGGGAENMSAVAMLKPSAGRQGVKDFVLQTVKKAGANPCPPLVVGIGIGGNLEKSALLAKTALLRPLNQAHHQSELAQLEQEILTEINNMNIGPLGFGGTTGALAVAIETYPCHIACLPVAVNLNCHVARHHSVVL